MGQILMSATARLKGWGIYAPATRAASNFD
jgi:hypothetical protein